jgi:Cu(I)/Ag(I) efflux system protein CusF
MNHRIVLRFAFVAALAAGVALPVAGQQAPAASAAQAAATAFAEGEVRKVDKPAGKITLKHGEIKNLDMPPMTMVFGVAEPGLLDQVKAGDKVRFRAVQKDGKYTVTEIQPAK